MSCQSTVPCGWRRLPHYYRRCLGRGCSRVGWRGGGGSSANSRRGARWLLSHHFLCQVVAAYGIRRRALGSGGPLVYGTPSVGGGVWAVACCGTQVLRGARRLPSA